MDKTRELETSPLLSLIVKYSIPAIVGMIIQSIYNVVDRYFIGLGVGDKGLAGVVVAFPYMLGFMAFGMLVGIGGVAALASFLANNGEIKPVLPLVTLLPPLYFLGRS
jgi:Na+-driven multidrug efflux pump